MKRESLFLILYLAGFAFTFCGALLKIYHIPNTTPVFVIGMVATLAFMILAIEEVLTRKDMSAFKKLLWTIGLLGMNMLAAPAYLISRRNYARKLL